MLSKSILRFSTARAFHSTAKKSLTIPFLSTLPQAPGGVKGTVNDAYVPPPSHKTHGSLHWDFERVIAISMVPLVTIPLATTGSISSVADSLLSSVLLAHCYVGFQSCIIDYIPKRVYGKNHNYAMYLLTLGSVLSALGIYKLQTEENGVVGILKKFWASDREEKRE